MSRSLGKAEHLGILQQSKASNHWNAVAAADAAYKTVQWINVGTLIQDPAVTVDAFNVTSHSGTHYEKTRFFVDSTSGLPKIPFSGTCDKTTLAAFLVGALQACTEAPTTPYNKIITPLGQATVPNWANNEGYLFTVAVKQNASADDGIILNNALIDTLNIVWDLMPNGMARLVSYNGTFIGNQIRTEQTLSGTWTNTTPAQTGFFNNTDTWGTTFGVAGGFTIDSVDYSAQCIRRFELQINNNIRKACASTGGVATNYIWSPEYKIMLSIDHNSVTEKIHNDYRSGADMIITWSNDSGGATTDGKWTIQLTNDGTDGGVGKLMSPPKSYEDDYIMLSLDARAYKVGDGNILAMQFCDTIDWAF